MGKKLRFALCAVFHTALGALGVGLLRTCRALRGLDISTLQYYFNTLKSEFSLKYFTGLKSLFERYSVIGDTAAASVKWAVPAALLLLVFWILSGLHTRIELCLHTRRHDCRIPLRTPPQRALRWCGGVLFFGALLSLALTVHLPRYLYLQNQSSMIYQDDYVEPLTADIRFPEKKRNLIHIYLESMETTYEDIASGGSWQENLIPQLTELAEDNISFSNVVSLTGTDYTTGALVAQTAGFPINRSVSKYAVNDEFLPYACTLHDVLADAGYRQIFMCGSDGEFGDRALYFDAHGDTEMWDYNLAVERGIVPDGYREQVGGWGLRDYILLDWAKDALEELVEGDQPFSLSLLTVDTHFYGGVTCEYCASMYDSKYENVIHCSDGLVAAFVQWCQMQPFYENTTIVITGDHPTMDFNFVSEHTAHALVDRGVYNCIIHPYGDLAPADDRQRQASTFDIYPTTLAALGAQWKGDQLAFGVNLFSDTPTLIEQKGRETLNIQLQMPADDYLEKFYHR